MYGPPSAYLSINQSASHWLAVFVSQCLTVHLSICPSACLPACLSVCLSVYVSICLLFYETIIIYLSVCLSVYVCLCMCVNGYRDVGWDGWMIMEGICLGLSERAYIHALMYTDTHTYIHTYIHTVTYIQHIQTNIHTDKQTCICRHDTSMHTYIHARACLCFHEHMHICGYCR